MEAEAKEGEEDGEKKEEEEEEGKDFEVEKVLNRKKSKGQWLYLVRWAGFDESEDTWEPLENLKGSKNLNLPCSLLTSVCPFIVDGYFRKCPNHPLFSRF